MDSGLGFRNRVRVRKPDLQHLAEGEVDVGLHAGGDQRGSLLVQAVQDLEQVLHLHHIHELVKAYEGKGSALSWARRVQLGSSEPEIQDLEPNLHLAQTRFSQGI